MADYKKAILLACKTDSLEAVVELVDYYRNNLDYCRMLRAVCEGGPSRGHILDWLLKTFTFTSYQRQFALRGCCYNGDMAATQHAVAQLKPTQNEIYIGIYGPFTLACESNLAIAQWLAQRYPPTESDIRDDNDRLLVGLAYHGKLNAMQMVCDLIPLPVAALYKPFKEACTFGEVAIAEWILKTYRLPDGVVRRAPARHDDYEMRELIDRYCAPEPTLAAPSEVAELKDRIATPEHRLSYVHFAAFKKENAATLTLSAAGSVY